MSLFARMSSSDWVTVSNEEAQQNRYFGLRGWLLFFYVVTVLGLTRNLMAAFGPIDTPSLQTISANPDIVRGFYIFLALVSVPFLVFALIKHPLTPAVWIGTILLNTITGLLMVDLSSLIVADLADNVLFSPIGRIFLKIGGACLMTWYVLNSKRVNVTYRSRIPANPKT